MHWNGSIPDLVSSIQNEAYFLFINSLKKRKKKEKKKEAEE